MRDLKQLIEGHEDWLTDRVIHYAQRKDFTQFSSTLREAWRMSICGLSKPLTKFLNTDPDSRIPHSETLRKATEFGVKQGVQHRARGIQLGDFLGLMKLYRNAYMDLVFLNADSLEDARQVLGLTIEVFDAIEVGLLESWGATDVSDLLLELQGRNRVLTNEKNKYLTVFESIAEPAILLGPDWEPTHVNAAANRLLLGEHEPGAGYYGDLSSPFLRVIIRKLRQSAGRTQGPVTIDTPSGERTFEVSFQEMLDISQKFAGSVIILQDVTDYERAIEAAQEADRAKSLFLNTVSHEIRTPINSILGLTGMLEDQDLPEVTLKRLRSIRTSGIVLSSLIENVLGLSRAEANALQLVEQDFDLPEMCTALFQVLELEETRRPVTLQTQIDGDVPKQLFGDGHKLRHVLMNLLSNAMKYTDEGTVVLCVSCVDAASDDQDQVQLRFEVRDTGRGVPEEAVDTLFDRFVQMPSENDGANAGGSGLGLAISRHLVEFLGGRITYRPNPSGGSIFGFCLPFAVSERAESLPECSTTHNILVVEDDPVNAIVIEGYLAELGNTVTVVNNYQDALKALDETRFELVVTDYRLGGHTGLDVARAALNLGDKRGVELPVLVVTAAIPHEERKELDQSDAIRFLEKPFTRFELAGALSAISKRLQEAAQQPEAARSSISHKDLNRLLSDLGFERCDAVVRSFQKNLPDLMARLEAKLTAEDYAGMSEVLHQLVSGAGFVGGSHLVDLTNQLRVLCKAHQLEELRREFAALKEESVEFLRDLDLWRAGCQPVERADRVIPQNGRG